MSHELRTPLNSVIGFANVLRRNRAGNLDEREIDYLDRILANGRHLLALIEDLLDLSRIEAGRTELERESVALDALLASTLEDLRGSVPAGVEMVARLPPSIEPVEADPRRMKQILINLVGNALKFTSVGRVTVSLNADPETGRARCIEVEDTGIGIPADRLETIFEAFEQGESGTARRYGGTGLGLAISASLARALGYRIEVESRVGSGSTFRLVLEP
jgi:signal transduction histidine kinase